MEGVLHGRSFAWKEFCDIIIIPYNIDMVVEPTRWAMQ
jgi:hypothetical protein